MTVFVDGTVPIKRNVHMHMPHAAHTYVHPRVRMHVTYIFTLQVLLLSILGVFRLFIGVGWSQEGVFSASMQRRHTVGDIDDKEVAGIQGSPVLH